MSSDPLHKAQRDFLNGRYAKVIALLEPLSLTYRDSHLFYYLIGSSCLFTGDIGGASTYLRRAEQLNFRHIKTLAALAAVHVRRGETDKAVQLYLDILEREPENRFAQKALSFLRSNSDPEKIMKLVNSGGISVLYPKPAVGIRRSIKAVFIIALLGLFAYIVLYLTPNAVHRIKEASPIRNGLESFNLSKEEKENPVSGSGSFDFILTEKEALSTFEHAKDLFRTWHDEAALIEINRILLSNAAPSIKSKADTLKGFVQKPDFTTVKDRYEYSDVAREPRLFEGVAVVWKGTATNVIGEDKGPTFDFLVGYHDKKRLEGIVTVKISFPMKIPSGIPIEILGRVRPVAKSFTIEGLSIHELREKEL